LAYFELRIWYNFLSNVLRNFFIFPFFLHDQKESNLPARFAARRARQGIWQIRTSARSAIMQNYRQRHSERSELCKNLKHYSIHPSTDLADLPGPRSIEYSNFYQCVMAFRKFKYTFKAGDAILQGVYILMLRTNDEVKTQKLIINR